MVIKSDANTTGASRWKKRECLGVIADGLNAGYDSILDVHVDKCQSVKVPDVLGVDLGTRLVSFTPSSPTPPLQVDTYSFN